MVNKKEEPRILNFNVMQYLEEEYFDWGKEKSNIFEEIEKGNYELFFEEIKERVLKFEDEIEKFGIIIQDKDVSKDIWDYQTNEYIIEPKKKHFHAHIRFKTKRRYSDVALIFGVEPQYVDSDHLKGRYGEENAWAYLIHAKEVNKFHYSPKEVKTFGLFDYMEYYARHKKKWEIALNTKRIKEDEVDYELLLEQYRKEIIEEGISWPDIVLRDGVKATNLKSKFNGKLNDIIIAAMETKSIINSSKVRNGELKFAYIYIQGTSDSGKSAYATELIKRLILKRKELTGEDWSYYLASSRSPFDQYGGEPIIFLNDIGARDNGLKPADWLNFLEIENKGALPGRNTNKSNASILAIQTSTHSLLEFFKQALGKGEDLKQIVRRTNLVIKVDEKSEAIEVYEINKIKSTERGKFLDLSKVDTSENSIMANLPTEDTMPQYVEKSVLKSKIERRDVYVNGAVEERIIFEEDFINSLVDKVYNHLTKVKLINKNFTVGIDECINDDEDLMIDKFVDDSQNKGYNETLEESSKFLDEFLATIDELDLETKEIIKKDTFERIKKDQLEKLKTKVEAKYKEKFGEEL